MQLSEVSCCLPAGSHFFCGDIKPLGTLGVSCKVLVVLLHFQLKPLDSVLDKGQQTGVARVQLCQLGSGSVLTQRLYGVTELIQAAMATVYFR